MSAGKRYLLDANVFIGAHQNYYGFDICPGFWLALARQSEAKRVFSIDRVRSELTAGGDALEQWAKTGAPDGFFKGTADIQVSEMFTDTIDWVQNAQQFTPAAKQKFAAGADAWVVAYARANDVVVVTHEQYSPDAKRRVQIPNVCIEFGVAHCNTFKMLRDLGEQFVLKKRIRRG